MGFNLKPKVTLNDTNLSCLTESVVLKMSPTKEVDYEQRAHRMINRWAGVQSAPRSNADRKAGSEIFTERSAQEQDIPGQSEQEYVVGKILKIINSNL